MIPLSCPLACRVVVEIRGGKDLYMVGQCSQSHTRVVLAGLLCRKSRTKFNEHSAVLFRSLSLTVVAKYQHLSTIS